MKWPSGPTNQNQVLDGLIIFLEKVCGLVQSMSDGSDYNVAKCIDVSH